MYRKSDNLDNKLLSILLIFFFFSMVFWAVEPVDHSRIDIPTFQPSSLSRSDSPNINNSSKNGLITLQTSEITIQVNVTDPTPSFQFWPTRENETIYSSRFIYLTEYEDADGDGAFQHNEINPKGKIFPFSSLERPWDFSGFYDVKNGSTSIGIGFNFSVKGKFNLPRLEPFSINVTNRLYFQDIQKTLEVGSNSFTLNISGLSSLKTNVRVNNWPFEKKKHKLALRWDLYQKGPKRVDSRMREKPINFGKEMKKRKEKPIAPETKHRIPVDLNTTGNTLSRFTTPNIVKTGQKHVTSPISYRTGNMTLKMFLSAPAPEEGASSILYDPIMEVIRDTSKPNLVLETPSYDAVVKERKLRVAWKGDDAETYLDHYKIQLDTHPKKKVGMNTSYVFKDLERGKHNINITAIDIVGNTVHTSVTFEVQFLDFFRVTVYGVTLAFIFVILLTTSVFYYLKKKKGAF